MDRHRYSNRDVDLFICVEIPGWANWVVAELLVDFSWDASSLHFDVLGVGIGWVGKSHHGNDGAFVVVKKN